MNAGSSRLSKQHIHRQFRSPSFFHSLSGQTSLECLHDELPISSAVFTRLKQREVQRRILEEHTGWSFRDLSSFASFSSMANMFADELLFQIKKQRVKK